MENHVILLVPIIPLVQMDDQNPNVHKPNQSKNSVCPLNKMQFTNGVPVESQVTL